MAQERNAVGKRTVIGIAVILFTIGGGSAFSQSFPTILDLNTLLPSGADQSFLLGPASLNRGYIVELSPLDDIGNIGHQAWVQPEFDGAAWNDVLHVRRSGMEAGAINTNVRVYAVATAPLLDFTDVLPSGVQQVYDVGPSSSDSSYVVEVSPLGAAGGGAFVEVSPCEDILPGIVLRCAEVRPEFNGATWRDVLRVRMMNVGVPVSANVRVYDVATMPAVFDFDFVLVSGTLHGFGLGPASANGGWVEEISPIDPSLNLEFVETFIQPEFGASWIDVLRVQNSIGTNNVNANIRVYAVSTVSPADQIDATMSSVQDLVTSGSLNSGQGNSLTKQLAQALKQLSKGKDLQAINMLLALIDHTNDLVSDGVLTPSEGQNLINQANALITQIQAP